MELEATAGETATLEGAGLTEGDGRDVAWPLPQADMTRAAHSAQAASFAFDRGPVRPMRVVTPRVYGTPANRPDAHPPPERPAPRAPRGRSRHRIGRFAYRGDCEPASVPEGWRCLLASSLSAPGGDMSDDSGSATERVRPLLRVRQSREFNKPNYFLFHSKSFLNSTPGVPTIP